MTFSAILGSNNFAVGRLTYTDQFGNDPNARIVVPVTFDNIIITTAILDTGAPWCVLNPEEAEVLNLDQRSDCWESSKPLSLRGMTYRGMLCRIPLSFNAEEGMGITIDATVFIPTLALDEEW